MVPRSQAPLVFGPEVLLEQEQIEAFCVRSGFAVRRVQLRAGGTHESSIACVEGDDRAPREVFDLAWLRGGVVSSESVGPALLVADLFSGGGGLSLGVREAARAIGRPAKMVLAAEIDVDAAAVYSRNFSEARIVSAPIESVLDGDIGSATTASEARLLSEIEAARPEIVVAGPPCQGHSDLNNHTRRSDPRNSLYLKVIRFVELVRPEHVLIENVPGVEKDHSAVLERAHAILSALGYAVDSGVMWADEVGVAQRRRRHFTIASRPGRVLATIAEIKKTFKCAHVRPVTWAIEDLAERVTDSIFDSPARPSAENFRRIQYLFANPIPQYDLPNEERPPCHRDKLHTYRAVYGRMWPDRPAPTITGGFGSSGQGRFLHPWKPRTLTPHEAARLQWFPDSFDFSPCRRRSALQAMIGNAVPSRMAYCVAVSVLR